MIFTNELGKENLTMLTDFYELTMANGFFCTDNGERTVYFDMFFRTVPDKGGVAIVAGIQQVIDYIKNLEFTAEDIAYLRSKNLFNDRFLDYLANFSFCCDVWAIPEGTPVFPYEPLVIVRGPAIQAQFIETMLLVLVNHQSLIATKASRIVRAAEGRPVMEFGSRRAQGADAEITIFDFDTVQDGATFAEPALPPKGIEWVLIGGEVALQKGEIVRCDLGKSIRK